jgi:pimeloyl-ACP methyl ester carboxylesterase
LLGVAAVLVISAGAFLAYRAWDPGSIRGSFDVGDRSLYIECVGAGAPTIVMETGLGGDHSAWEQVVPDLRGANQTCTYDRANVGESDQAPTPRTSADVVADLHGLLEAAGIPAPYVLVGHSFGGISMRLYASTYPDDVADLVGSANALSAAGPLPAVPLLVLVADDHSQDAVTDPEVQQRFEAMWQGRQQELATSVQGGRMELVSSGRNIQSLRPEAVTEAIRSVISELPPAP